MMFFRQKKKMPKFLTDRRSCLFSFCQYRGIIIFMGKRKIPEENSFPEGFVGFPDIISLYSQLAIAASINPDRLFLSELRGSA